MDSDLKALQITHTQCVDTAILFPHPRGFPYRIKLKELAETYLNITIQRNHSSFTPKIVQNKDKNENSSNDKNKSENKNKNSTSRVLVPLGHDSIEDAATAMRLVYLKIEKGPDFGSKIPLTGRIPLARFLTGSGKSSNDPLNNLKNNFEKGKNDCITNVENTEITNNPLITFFWDNNVECKTMNSCICEDTVYNPPGSLEENLTALKDVFSFRENDEQKQNSSENSVKITENNDLLRNQILCYFGVKLPNFSAELSTVEDSTTPSTCQESKVKKTSDELFQKSKNEEGIKFQKKVKMNEFLIKVIENIKDTLKETKQGCLIIITAQQPLSIVSNLLKQKSACENPQTVSRWTRELDIQLKEAYSKCNIAHMITTTI